MPFLPTSRLALVSLPRQERWQKKDLFSPLYPDIRIGRVLPVKIVVDLVAPLVRSGRRMRSGEGLHTAPVHGS